MTKKQSVAIIGAGLSGLSCAQALKSAGVNVCVYERAPVIGGRCATQLWQGHLVDTGVQYFTAQSAEFKRELLTKLRQFRPIISPILDGDRHALPSPRGPRFYVLQGNNYFAYILSLGIDVRPGTRVESIKFKSGEIECEGETFQAVVSTIPGSLTAQLFGLTQSPADYDSCIVALLEYAGTSLGRSRDCYGCVESGGDIVQASYCENNKVGRIVGPKTVFVVEAAPNFSSEFAGAPSETYLPLLARRHEEIWGIPSGHRTAAFGLVWPFARPQTGQQRGIELPPGAFICGDSRANPSVEDVWMDGKKAANEVRTYLESLSG